MNKIKCCEEMNIIESWDYHVCSSCGVINNYPYEYIRINEKKTAFGYDKVKYLEIKLKKLFWKNKILNFNEKDNMINKIIYIYIQLNNIIKEKKIKNKYSLNYNFIIYKIMEYLNYDLSYNKISENEKMIDKYNKIWNEIIIDLNICPVN